MGTLPSKNINIMKEAANQAWLALGKEYLRQICDAVPGRLTRILAANSGHIDTSNESNTTTRICPRHHGGTVVRLCRHERIQSRSSSLRDCNVIFRSFYVTSVTISHFRINFNPMVFYNMRPNVLLIGHLNFSIYSCTSDMHVESFMQKASLPCDYHGHILGISPKNFKLPCSRTCHPRRSTGTRSSTAPPSLKDLL